MEEKNILESTHHHSLGLETEQSILKSHLSFFGHGKLLLTGEYFVLDGAKALALPCSQGQTLNISFEKSFKPSLEWKSYDYDKKQWFEAKFEFWHFNVESTSDEKVANFLQKVLRQARRQNPHFLREEVSVKVETKLDFPLCWGLGSSSTLIYNIAQWAYISPFELHNKTCGGSGYDIACAGSEGPIIYEKKSKGQNFVAFDFNPDFADKLYFLYLGKKKDSSEAVADYKSLVKDEPMIDRISEITEEIKECADLDCFENLINEHEDIVSNFLSCKKVKDIHFKDFWGSIKSLGAWGGDFVLVCSKKSEKETREYFSNLGFDVFIPYKDMILPSNIVVSGSASSNKVQ